MSLIDFEAAAPRLRCPAQQPLPTVVPEGGAPVPEQRAEQETPLRLVQLEFTRSKHRHGRDDDARSMLPALAECGDEVVEALAARRTEPGLSVCPVLGEDAAADELGDLALPLAEQRLVGWPEDDDLLVAALQVRRLVSPRQTLEQRIGHGKGDECLPHADLVGKNLDLPTASAVGVVEALQERLRRRVLARGVLR